jgi:hypothetical protein
MGNTTIIAADCTWVDWWNQSTNYGTGTTVRIHIYNDGSDYPQRLPYFRIPTITDIPKGAITSFRLYLYGYSEQASPLMDARAQLVTGTWTETGITWSNKGGATGALHTMAGNGTTFPYGSGNAAWRYIALPPKMATDWRDGLVTNAGVYLTRDLAGGLTTRGAYINSDDASSNQPYFYVETAPIAFKTI